MSRIPSRTPAQPGKAEYDRDESSEPVSDSLRRPRDLMEATALGNDSEKFASPRLQQPARAQTKQASSTSRSRQPLPAALSRGHNIPIGAAISRPAPMPQWPLPEPVHEESSDARGFSPMRP